MNLRWIDLGVTEPKWVYSTWEFSRILKLEEPVIFSYIIDRRVVDMTSNIRDFDYFVYMDKLPDDVELHRFHAPNRKVGTVVWSSGVIGFNLHVPSNLPKEIETKPIAISLRKNGILSILKNNDMFLVYPDNTLKKCYGIVGEDWGNGWMTYNSMLSFKPDIKLMDSILKKDIDKFTKKPPFNSFGDIIGGIYDINLDVNMDKVKRDIIKEISSVLRCNVIEDSLTDEEYKMFDNLGNGLNKEEWIFDLKHPLLGDVRK